MKSWVRAGAILGTVVAVLLADASTDGQAAIAADATPPLTAAAALNKAARQRMLSQRLAKAYLMVALGVRTEEGRRILSESAAQFDAQLAELKAFAPNAEVKSAAAALEKDWAPYREALARRPDLEGAKEVYGLSDTALNTAHRLTLACERLSGAAAVRAILISGRERMLSQRLARLYFFMLANINTPAVVMELRMTRGEFVQGLSQLAVSPHTTAAIRARLEQVHAEWLAYEKALGAGGPDARSRAPEVAARSERLLELLEGVVAAYEEAAPQD